MDYGYQSQELVGRADTLSEARTMAQAEAEARDIDYHTVTGWFL